MLLCCRMSSISTADLWWLLCPFSPTPTQPLSLTLLPNSFTRSSNRVGSHLNCLNQCNSFCTRAKICIFVQVISSSKRELLERKCTLSRRALLTLSWATVTLRRPSVTALTLARFVFWLMPVEWPVLGLKPIAIFSHYQWNTSMPSWISIHSWEEHWRVLQPKGIVCASLFFSQIQGLGVIFHFLCRLNKIGKNPTMVSNREDLQSDCKTVNAIVSGMTTGGHSGPGSTEEFGGHHLGHRRRSSTGRIHNYLYQHSPTMSPPYSLPRPRSENNFALAAAAASMAAAAFGVPSGSVPDDRRFDLKSDDKIRSNHWLLFTC